MVDEKKVWKSLKEVMDPELGISVVDLGLVYEVKVDKDRVYIKMTMTTPGCPLYNFMMAEVQKKVEDIEGIKQAKVDLVWDPPWTPQRMSRELREKMGISDN